MALSSFEKAFASARKAGKKVFDWNGKSYNTKLATDVKNQKSLLSPLARPKASSASPVSQPSTPAKSPFSQLKANIAKDRADRNANRAAAKTDSLAAMKDKGVSDPKKPKNKSPASKAAVKKSMSKAAGANFR